MLHVRYDYHKYEKILRLIQQSAFPIQDQTSWKSAQHFRGIYPILMNSSIKLSRPGLPLNISLPSLAFFLLLVFAILINIKMALPFFSSPLLPDAINSYLPYAQSLLSDKLAFFLDARSLRTVPMTFIYPALFGANPEYIKLGNMVLSCLIVVIMFRLGSQLHSRTAGILAALFYAASPVLAEYKLAVLSEPPYFFFTALWLMSVVEIVGGKKWFVPVAGIACGLMILTRGTYIYFLYATLLITLVMSIKGQRQQLGRQLFAAHCIALAFPAAVIIKNWVVFGYPSIGPGTGAALYFGSLPLTGGYEAPYYGLPYDIGAVVQGLDHLSIEGDKLLKAVALHVLQQQSIGDVLGLYLQKAFAFAFSTKAVLPATIWNQRTFRIVEIIFTVIGLFHLRMPLLRWFLGGALAYQFLVHVPLLFNPRYSIGALEIPLLLMSAVGVAGLIASWNNNKKSNLKLAGVAVLVIVAIGTGELHRKYSQELMPDILAVPHTLVHEWQQNQFAALPSSGMSSEGNGQYLTNEKHWTLDVPIQDLKLAKGEEIYVYSISMTATPSRFWKNCGEAAAYFKSEDEPNFSEAKSRHFRIIADGKPRTYHLSATYYHSPIYPDKAGVLRISGNCPRTTQIKMNSMKLSKSRAGRAYREEYLAQRK